MYLTKNKLTPLYSVLIFLHFWRLHMYVDAVMLIHTVCVWISKAFLPSPWQNPIWYHPGVCTWKARHYIAVFGDKLFLCITFHIVVMCTRSHCTTCPQHKIICNNIPYNTRIIIYWCLCCYDDYLWSTSATFVHNYQY